MTKIISSVALETRHFIDFDCRQCGYANRHLEVFGTWSGDLDVDGRPEYIYYFDCPKCSSDGEVLDGTMTVNVY